jgi:hypothetical protein
MTFSPPPPSTAMTFPDVAFSCRAETLDDACSSSAGTSIDISTHRLDKGGRADSWRSRVIRETSANQSFDIRTVGASTLTTISDIIQPTRFGWVVLCPSAMVSPGRSWCSVTSVLSRSSGAAVIRMNGTQLCLGSQDKHRPDAAVLVGAIEKVSAL